MLYTYKTTTKDGIVARGTVDAPNIDLAISSLQRRGLIVVSIAPLAEPGKSFLSRLTHQIRQSDLVIISRQISTLFEAKVSVQETFLLLASESENPLIQRHLTEITDDIRSGVPISTAMEKHPEMFTPFYVSMVRSGEESGKLSETFNYLADYLDRSYALVSKAKNALIYPIFVIITFLLVMAIMVVFVIPKLGLILADSGQELPFYTRIILGISNFVSNYWFIFVGMIVVTVIILIRYAPTEAGKQYISRLKLSVPYIGDLYRKLYLSRIADNMDTMITSGVSMVRSLDITADVVDNYVYRDILRDAATAVKAGAAVSETFATHPEIPRIMIQMIKVGEESGRLGFTLKTMASFYRREVENAVDTLVGLIEPVMIVFLGLAVGVLLTAVLVPIYNVASSF